MSLSINLLPVNKGDCIHIRFEDETGAHNIIIDSGPSVAARAFRNLLKKISDSDEELDLLCFTHIDDDHIGAATKVLSDQDLKCDFIHHVWLNCDKNESEKDDEKTRESVTDMSVSKMLRLQQYLLDHNISIENDIIQGKMLEVGTAEIYVLTPSAIDHEAYRKYLSEKLKKLPMSAEDKSITNADSIALMLTYQDNQFLFTGDIHASELENALNDTDKVKQIYCAQLPHHGSSRNLTEALLDKMNTMRFMVSSERSVNRPSRETVLLLEQYKPQIEKTLLCNFKLEYKIEDAEHLKCIDLREESFNDSDEIQIVSEAY